MLFPITLLALLGVGTAASFAHRILRRFYCVICFVADAAPILLTLFIAQLFFTYHRDAKFYSAPAQPNGNLTDIPDFYSVVGVTHTLPWSIRTILFETLRIHSDYFCRITFTATRSALALFLPFRSSALTSPHYPNKLDSPCNSLPSSPSYRMYPAMEILTIQPFLQYFTNLRERTMRVARCIPPGKIDWTYAPGKFTLGDLLRHIAVAERYMWAETLQNQPSRFTTQGKELADGLEKTLAFMERLHAESMEIFSRLSDADLQRKCQTPDSAPITTWKWLRLMVEHEIHHRGQIYLYLGILDIPAPALYGLTSEQVRAHSFASAE